MKNRRNITGILLAIVSAVLFVSLICLCRKYQSQTKELQAELAYANAAKEEYTTELRNLQTQLAERRSLEENTTETGFVKKGGIYLIDTRSQLIALSQMIQERLEIESDISAAEASYRLRSNIELGTYWFSIGTEETPFCGKIGELNSGFRRKNNGYHIIIEGEWDGTEVPLQHLFIPFTEIEMADLGASESYYIENVDINFDGTPDLLIHEGFSGGSGGSWNNYRAIVWDRKSGQFVYYPSFPEQLAFLEFDRQNKLPIQPAIAIVNGSPLRHRKK